MDFGAGYRKAMEFYERGQLRLAADELNRLLHQELLAGETWKACNALSECYFRMGEFEQSAAWYDKTISCFSCVPLQQQQRLCSNYLFLLHYLPGISAAELAAKHFRYAAVYEAPEVFTHGKRSGKRLKVAYLSPDFSDHVDMLFFIQLLACRTKERYEVVCYSLAPKEDDTTSQLRTMVDGWQSLYGLSAREAAQQIHEQEVDILFDLSGHAHGGETLSILSWHPAPVQLCGIGYMSTTGMKAVDYYLTDNFCDPPGSHEAFFSERLIRLPHTHLCYTPSQRSQLAQAAYEGYRVHTPRVFGSFNNFAKITDDMLRIWLQILQQVPGARLLLKNSSSSAYLLRSLRKRAERIGFAPGQLELRPASGNYLAEYPDMDIALDTYPYPGGGTTCDALYMGVPVISLYGDRHGSRFGYSLLQNVGLQELTASSKDEYIRRAVMLAQDAALLQELHQSLRTMLQQSPIMNGTQYTREVEAAYEKMWAAWLAR